jgi:hypothetical protein
MLKRFTQASACVMLFAGAATLNTAEARVTAGAGFGIGQFEYDDIDNGSAKKFYLGYEMDDNPVYFEFAAVDSGDADVTSFQGVTLNVSGTTLGIGYRGVVNPGTGSAFFFKGGLYNTDTEVSGPGGTATEGGSGLYLGLGGDWMFAPTFGLRFDLEGLLGVKDFADDKNVTLMTVGPVIKFGGADASK